MLDQNNHNVLTSVGRCTSGAVVGRPCAQLKHSCVRLSAASRSRHSEGSSGWPNMTAERQALERSTRVTPGGGRLEAPPASSSWLRYSCGR